MRKKMRSTSHTRPVQGGFTLVEMMAVLAVLTLLSGFAAVELKRRADDSAAEATGRYLSQVRGAVVDLQLKHEAWLRGEDVASAPAGTYPPPPVLTWTSVSGAQVARGRVDDLITLGHMPATTPRFPVLGDTAKFLLVRQGTCPGVDCKTTAFVYTCHPVSSLRSLRQSGGCVPPVGGRASYSPALLGRVMSAAEGYGGHDATSATHINGPLLSVPRSWFDFGGEPGHAAVAAGLEATPFGQFVRHGETRPVTLHNKLTVGGVLQTDTGLILNTSVVPGASCDVEGIYASTANKQLATCVGGAWFTQAGKVITGTFSDLPHDAAVPAPTCPAGMTPWRHVSLQGVDATVRGGDLNIGGAVGGTIQGSGYVNAAGAVTVGGAFNGTFQNSGASYVRVAQRVSLVANRIQIAPADPSARASVIQGCGS